MGQANLVSIRKSAEELKLLELCEKHLTPKGFRIVDVDCNLAGRTILRVFVERPGKTGVSPSVSIEDCAEASRALDPILDTETWIPSRFELEVSSPGIERRLRLKEDFQNSVGEEIKLKLVEKTEDGSLNVTGRLCSANDEAIAVAWQGKEISILLSNIRKANRVWREKPEGKKV